MPDFNSQTEPEYIDHLVEKQLHQARNTVHCVSLIRPAPLFLLPMSTSNVIGVNLLKSPTTSPFTCIRKACFKCATTIKDLLFLSIVVLLSACLIYNLIMPNGKDIKEKIIQNFFQLLILSKSNPGSPCKCQKSRN